MKRRKERDESNGATACVVALGAIAVIAVSFPWWDWHLAIGRSATAQTETADIQLEAPLRAVDEAPDAVVVAPAPVQTDQLPGMHNRPRRQPPPLLSEAQVEGQPRRSAAANAGEAGCPQPPQE